MAKKKRLFYIDACEMLLDKAVALTTDDIKRDGVKVGVDEITDEQYEYAFDELFWRYANEITDKYTLVDIEGKKMNPDGDGDGWCWYDDYRDEFAQIVMEKMIRDEVKR